MADRVLPLIMGLRFCKTFPHRARWIGFLYQAGGVFCFESFNQSNQIMKRIRLVLLFVGIALATRSGFAGNASLTSVSAFSGTVTYGGADTDWRVFAATNNNGNAVISSTGGGLISGIFTDGGIGKEHDITIPASWTSGTPVASAVADTGYYAVLGGNQYSEYIGRPNYAYFTVASPSANYTVDLYIDNWGYQSYLDLTLINGTTTNTYNNFASGKNYFEHIVVGVTGSTVGSLTTIKFADFEGNDAWGQLGFFSADVISVPEPSTVALAGLGGLSLLWLRRFKP